MSMKQEKVVINCAVTAQSHPEPVGIPAHHPQQISEEAIKLPMPAPEPCISTSAIPRRPALVRPGALQGSCGEIHRKSNVVVCPTTAGIG